MILRSDIMASNPTNVSSSAIIHRLRERFPLADGWITMGEVTPPGTKRRFDLIAIMGWQSRGHEVLGFEVKVSRSDWLAELKDPAKADPLVRLCSRWWIAAPPDVVKVEELPAAWGLLVIHPEQVRAIKQAPQLNPEPWSPEVWRCMMLRQATREQHAPDDLEKAKRAGWTEGYEEGAKSAERMQKSDRDHIAALEKIIAEAEKATGVQIRFWCDYPALGEAMRLVRDSGSSRIVEKMEKHARELRETALRMRKAARSIRGNASESQGLTPSESG